MSTPNNKIWDGAYKIPWDEPNFSRRMLREHLTQDHDMASRRVEWIDRQAAWIHEGLLAKTPSIILDLGCGPGFYSHRLASLGHTCHGIDFGPASIEYACQHNPDESLCTFALGDIRQMDLGTTYDLVMILFGELNVFSPDDAAMILAKARVSLRSGRHFIVELQTPDTIESSGRAEPSEKQFQSGLFSDRPHVCRTENCWLADEMVAIQTFTVTEKDSGQTQTYRNTTQAWSDERFSELMTKAGFHNVAPEPQWPCNTDALKLWHGTTNNIPLT